MYALSSNITINKTHISAISDVRIRRSIFTLGATATIKLPVTALLKQQGEPTTRVEIASHIKVGDRVTIELGYDGNNKTEFVGYVKGVNLKTPVEIECEDEFYTTRNRSVKNSGTTSLKEFLEKSGLKVGYCEKLTLKNFAIKEQPLSKVLAKISQDYGLSIFFDFDGEVYVAQHKNVQGKAVKYVLRENVINEDNLQYITKADITIQIKAIYYDKDGTKVEVLKGKEGGAVKRLYFYDVSDDAELSVLAERELERHSYDGYDGSITTFLLPYAQPTYVADIKDNKYPQRDGRYYIEAVDVIFGRGGARRKLQIGQTV